MDVTNAEEARIAEEAGAVAVMALERVPAGNHCLFLLLLPMFLFSPYVPVFSSFPLVFCVCAGCFTCGGVHHLIQPSYTTMAETWCGVLQTFARRGVSRARVCVCVCVCVCMAETWCGVLQTFARRGVSHA
jgi:hypothetical protein